MTTVCGACGAKIKTEGPVIEVRKPCEFCGSLERKFYAEFCDNVTIREQLTMKLRREGHREPIFESKIGDSLFEKDGTWSHIEQSVDRENNIYRKLIIDEKGAVLRNEIKPLSEHMGHGSAKIKKTP